MCVRTVLHSFRADYIYRTDRLLIALLSNSFTHSVLTWSARSNQSANQIYIAPIVINKVNVICAQGKA